MFTPLHGQTALGIAPQSVVAVIESINIPNISIPEIGTEPTKAYLVGCRTPGGGAAIFCYLLESASIQFVESMGFLLDNLNFLGRSSDEQQLLIKTLPFFYEQQPRMPRAQALSAAGMAFPKDQVSPEQLAVARFLASF